VVYRSVKEVNLDRTRLKSTTNSGVTRTSFYSSDPNSLSYSLRLPFIITSLATWEIENNLKSAAISNGVVSKIMIDTALTALINRDQFAQVAEQVRYFYMSSIGYGGSAADIVDKTTFIRVRHHWELLYILRSYKLAATLSSISTAGRLSSIDSKLTGELKVAFPHTDFPSNSFSQSISSMYICNIYNKFRAFHEVSEAICFNEVISEKSIYNQRVSQNIYAVAGLSPELYSCVVSGPNKVYEYINSKEFIKNEVRFNNTLATLKSQRYTGSATFMIGASAMHAKIPEAIIDSIYDKLNRGPIDACTMKGSMDAGLSTGDHQGIRAASTVLEELIRKSGKDPKYVNKSLLGSVYLMDELEQNKPVFSILSCTIDQFNDGSIVYRYRIVQKDQKGHREISVLNFNFRVGALFVETISRELSLSLPEIEVVNNPNKDKIIEDLITDTFKLDKTTPGTHCYDNSDQKRWGPNHNMNFFAYALLPMLATDAGLFRLVIRVFDLVFDKRAKFPESLIDLIIKKNITASRSIPINTFINFASSKISNKVFEETIYQGMCQGIFQGTSSLVHALKVLAQTKGIQEVYPRVTIRGLTTSDDAETTTHIPPQHNKIEVVKVSHCIGLRVGNLFNIVRSNPKSSFNFHIAELNSNFFKKGKLATPSIKQRIAKIDVGMGLNHIEDYLTILASSANYLANGGSYMGSVIVSILNLTLHTEQWLRWEFAKSDQFYKPVELGGFPVVEPLTTILSGGIANMYLRVSNLINSEAYSRLIVESLLCPPEPVTLEDFARTGVEKVNKTYADKDVTIFKGTGPLGIFQLAKTDRKLSQFERRHGISKWLVPDKFATLKRDSPIASDFIFSLFRSTSVHTLETNLGVNSFFIRMAEPWASYTRPCLRVSESSPFAKVFSLGGSTISHKELSDKFKSLTILEAGYELVAAFRRCTRHSIYEVMENQLSVRLSDAVSIREFLATQEAETFKLSNSYPTIQKVTLRGHTASDADSYMLAILKTLSGVKSRELINSYRRSTDTYRSIPVSEPTKPLDLLTSIVLTDNAIALYGKFIRRDTKMILPNKVNDLKDLCMDIISNKFTENLGMVTDGSLELNPERTKPHAYSKWYQDLVKTSASQETLIANAIMKSEAIPGPTLGITSGRMILTSSDMFEVTNTSVPEKTVLIDSRSKDSFITTVRTWLSAKVRFLLSRTTIRSLIAGRLTFAHDYYTGNNRFFRFAKTKYFKIRAGSAEGTHIIQTTVLREGGKLRTSYRHTILFGEDVTGRKVEVEIQPLAKDQVWANTLAAALESTPINELDSWTRMNKDISNYSNPLSYRKTEKEDDYFRFSAILPGQEFKLSESTNSLCINLSRGNLEFPVTYLNPAEIESVELGYTLKHSDMVLATKSYAKLREISDNFSRDRIRYWEELQSAFDFILTGSTTDTPDYIIDRVLFKFVAVKLNTVQLDILRTFLIKNPKFGISYSANRFNQYLLNLGHRRNHFHSYLCKTVMGEMAAQDSEDWDIQSAEEDILLAGKSNPNELQDIDSNDEYEPPDYVKNYSALEEVDQTSLDHFSSAVDCGDISLGKKDWAEEVQDAFEAGIPDEALDVQTAIAFDNWTDSEDEIDGANLAGSEADWATHNETSNRIPSVTTTQADRTLPQNAVDDSGMGFFSNAFDGVNFDDVFFNCK